MQTATATEPKTPRRQSTRKKSKPETATKQKLTLYVTADGAKRLGVHAQMLNTDRSALVERLITDHLRRFVVSDREKPVDADLAKSDGEVNRPAGSEGGS
jgi:hypothetical protein